MAPLSPAPANLATATGELLTGLWAGSVDDDPVRSVRRRGGRVRRWSYAAAAGDEAAIGAAIVDVGVGANAFAWLAVGDEVHTWERTAIGGRGVEVARRPGAASSARLQDATLTIDQRGGIRLDVPTAGGRLRAEIEVPRLGTPATCATPTPGGGWNVTRKHAGYDVRGRASLDASRWDLDLGGWSDWTAGRQDRRTSWRWAAGAGKATTGQRVGINLSTGMNGAVGEDVVWWDGVPYRLDADELAPVDDPRGAWRVAGPGWSLDFETAAVRAADESLVLIRSSYVQPIGRFVGTLPGPDGDPVSVELTGVTEDHHAVW